MSEGKSSIFISKSVLVLIFLWLGDSPANETTAGQKKAYPNSIAVLFEYPASSEWVDITERALSTLIDDGTYKGEVSFNSKHQTPSLSFILFDSVSFDQSSSYVRNCRYSSMYTLIVCDVQLFDTILHAFDFHKRQESYFDDLGQQRRFVTDNTPEQIAYYRELILRWILVHEIGHHVRGHRGEFFYLPPKGHNFAPSYSKSVINTCQQQELEADVFLVEQSNREWINNTFYLFLMEAVNREIIRLSCPDQSVVLHCENVYPGVGMVVPGDLLMVKSTRTHPAILIRLLEMIVKTDNEKYQYQQLLELGLKDLTREYPSDTECQVIE